MSPTPAFWMIPSAPTPVGPFSHATEADGWVFLTGQMPTSPIDDSASLPDGVVAQTQRVMDNLILVLQGVGLTLQHVIAVRIFLTEFKRDYAPMNAIYSTYFNESKRPGRTTVGVTDLARGGIIEIDLIAFRS